MNWPALRTSLLLSILFLLVYGGSNELAAHRAGIGSYCFGWERHIPFVPLMIVPYMSIDLFFIAAPFLCDDRGRKILARRVAMAIVVAGAFFVLLPLRFAFGRPALTGPLRMLFHCLQRFDRPFNQFPSLHVALLVVLLGVYWGCTRGLLRGALAVWFLLIGLSTVLTYQHHAIDVAGGLALGILCIYVFPIDSWPHGAATTNRRVAAYYAAAALAAAACAGLLRPMGWLLIWPAMSLAIAAFAYAGGGARIYRKAHGYIPLTSWLVLGPLLLGQRLSLMYYRRQCGAWDVLTDRLWIGRTLSIEEGAEAVRQGVSCVVDLTAELPESQPLLCMDYQPIPILDLTAPTDAMLDRAVDCIRREAERGIVYVHCKAGYSRTAAVAGAYLLADGLARSVEEALAMMRRARPTIVIRSEARAALQRYHAQLSLNRLHHRLPPHDHITPAKPSIPLMLGLRSAPSRWALDKWK